MTYTPTPAAADLDRRRGGCPLPGHGMIDDMTAAAAPAAPAYGCVSLRQTATVITRTALAYSNIRKVRWWLAYVDLPLMWLLTCTPIVRHPELVAHLGVASTQLERLPVVAGAPRRPPGNPLLVAAAVVLLAVLILGPVAIVAILGSSAAAALITLIWYGLLILLPMLTYALPALVQQWHGRGRAAWIRATEAETGRRPLLFTELAAWPAKGGGRRGTGDGFDLVKAVAADARRDGAILICTARTAALAERYRADTGAVASPTNPRLLRWP